MGYRMGLRAPLCVCDTVKCMSAYGCGLPLYVYDSVGYMYEAMFMIVCAVCIRPGRAGIRVYTTTVRVRAYGYDLRV